MLQLHLLLCLIYAFAAIPLKFSALSADLIAYSTVDECP